MLMPIPIILPQISAACGRNQKPDAEDLFIAFLVVVAVAVFVVVFVRLFFWPSAICWVWDERTCGWMAFFPAALSGLGISVGIAVGAAFFFCCRKLYRAARGFYREGPA